MRCVLSTVFVLFHDGWLLETVQEEGWRGFCCCAPPLLADPSQVRVKIWFHICLGEDLDVASCGSPRITHPGAPLNLNLSPH